MNRLITTFSVLIWLTNSTFLFAQQTDSESKQPSSHRQISGIYPHLTVYGIYSENGAHTKPGHNECGIGAVVPWAGKLWMVNYAPHMPHGSEHKLFSIDNDLQLTIHPESVGGTPAGRMIHRESKQLLIGHHLIDESGKVRTISPEKMPMRVTAIARHLLDPAHKVYYIDMEGSIWEADVDTLEVRQLFKKPVPGWHGKGGYTSQGRLIVSNNGELPVGDYKDLLVGSKSRNLDEAGVLAEWDGNEWRIIERRQFTDITGPGGLQGESDQKLAWAIGWDKSSLRLKVLSDGSWSTFLLPKASFCNDARHGWYTEWPRIREVQSGKWMMDMHGMFFDFPADFSPKQPHGLKPIGSHLRYVPDFCDWNGKLVLATDETSIQENKLAGQPQTNLWFGDYSELKNWGPATGYGGPWLLTEVKKGEVSEPFLVAGFTKRTIHIAEGETNSTPNLLRTADQLPLATVPDQLRELPRVTIPRGDWRKPAPGFSFRVNAPVVVWLSVDGRGKAELSSDWELTELATTMSSPPLSDKVFKRKFDAGLVEIPGNSAEHIPGSFGLPHLAWIEAESNTEIIPEGQAELFAGSSPSKSATSETEKSDEIVFELEIMPENSIEWQSFDIVKLPRGGYRNLEIPSALSASWLRVKSAQDCVATVQLHLSNSYPHAEFAGNESPMFSGLMRTDETFDRAPLLYPNKNNRNLSLLFTETQRLELDKESLTCKEVELDPKMIDLVDPVRVVKRDDLSAYVEYQGTRWRFPGGYGEFYRNLKSREIREVESERILANLAGTFYEIPLVENGAPPAFDKMRPIATHQFAIYDYCSWNGLLVLSNDWNQQSDPNHYFIDPKYRAKLWLGGIDDLWKIGKPVGQGGPWKLTDVKANVPSDPYLMTGFTPSSLSIWADVSCEVTAEIDFDHVSGWHPWKTFRLRKDEPFDFTFPEGFSAHWIRFRSNRSGLFNAMLDYE